MRQAASFCARHHCTQRIASVEAIGQALARASAEAALPSTVHSASSAAVGLLPSFEPLACHAAANSVPSGNNRAVRVVLSMSTLPARLHHVGPWLRALLAAQTVKPDAAYVAVRYEPCAWACSMSLAAFPKRLVINVPLRVISVS